MSDVAVKAWHERNHYFGYGSAVPQELCWFCQRAARQCRAKVRYDSPRSATEDAKRLLACGELDRPVVPYCCKFCDGWHLTSARGKHQLRKAEKWRRKALR